MNLIRWAIAVIVAYVLIVVVLIKLGRGHELLAVFTNASGTPCCGVDATSVGPPDCAVISEDVAMSAGIGSTVMVPLPWGNIPTVIDIIHPSPTENDYACTTGCLIRRTLY